MLDQDTFRQLEDRLVTRCGTDLAIYAEHMRQFAHECGEDAVDDEGRIRSQAAAVIWRDMARIFRGEHDNAKATALAQDRVALEGSLQQ